MRIDQHPLSAYKMARRNLSGETIPNNLSPKLTRVYREALTHDPLNGSNQRANVKARPVTTEKPPVILNGILNRATGARL